MTVAARRAVYARADSKNRDSAGISTTLRKRPHVQPRTGAGASIKENPRERLKSIRAELEAKLASAPAS